MNYKPIIVIDDDNEEVRKIFKLKAVKANVEIKDFATWDKTKEYLESNSNVDAIVLDARGQLNPDTDASDVHLLNSLIFVQNKVIPYAIYTAYTDELPILNQQIEEGRVFTKGKHKEEDIFEFLKKKIEESPKLKIVNRYPGAFVVFNKRIIKSEYEHNLIEMLSCLERQDFKKKNLNVIRDVLESVFLTMIDDYECLPETFKNHNRPNLEWCTRYLEGKPTNDAARLDMEIPNYISSSIRYIKEISSIYSHLSENAIVKTSFISAAYSMLEVLEWLPKFIEDNFES